MQKKVVQFLASKTFLSPQVGMSAVIVPVDHPDKHNVSNHKPATTSTVVKVNEDGSFETMNTIYNPVKE